MDIKLVPVYVRNDGEIVVRDKADSVVLAGGMARDKVADEWVDYRLEVDGQPEKNFSFIGREPDIRHSDVIRCTAGNYALTYAGATYAFQVEPKANLSAMLFDILQRLPDGAINLLPGRTDKEKTWFSFKEQEEWRPSIVAISLLSHLLYGSKPPQEVAELLEKAGISGCLPWLTRKDGAEDAVAGFLHMLDALKRNPLRKIVTETPRVGAHAVRRPHAPGLARALARERLPEWNGRRIPENLQDCRSRLTLDRYENRVVSRLHQLLRRKIGELVRKLETADTLAAHEERKKALARMLADLDRSAANPVIREAPPLDGMPDKVTTAQMIRPEYRQSLLILKLLQKVFGIAICNSEAADQCLRLASFDVYQLWTSIVVIDVLIDAAARCGFDLGITSRIPFDNIHVFQAYDKNNMTACNKPVFSMHRPMPVGLAQSISIWKRHFILMRMLIAAKDTAAMKAMHVVRT